MITLSDKMSPAMARGSVCGGPIDRQVLLLAQWLRTLGDTTGLTSPAVGLCGCVRGAGTSTISMQLAAAAAEAGDSAVLLLDLSGHGSAPSRRFSLADARDWNQALANPALAAACAQRTPVLNLHSLSCGLSHVPPEHVPFEPRALHDLLEALKTSFKLILVDLPPADSARCATAAALLDGVLLVVESESTHWDVAAQAKQTLIQANAHLLGAVLNKHRPDLPRWLDARL